MALDILVTLATLVSDGAALLHPRAPRPLRANEVFVQLDVARQRALIEVAVAAALEDGRLSADEKEWLDERRAASKGPDLIDSAVVAVTAALGSPIDAGKLGAFLEERAAVLGDVETREASFELAGHLLRQAGHVDHLRQLRAFGEGLDIETARIEELVAELGGRA